MNRFLALMLAILVASPGLAKGPGPTEGSAAGSRIAAKELSEAGEKSAAPIAEGAKRPPKNGAKTPPLPDRPGIGKKLEPTLPSPRRPGGSPERRVPTEGRIPLPAPVDRPVVDPRPAPGSEGVRRALQDLLTVDGRTGQVDLRGQEEPVARFEWRLEAPRSDLALLSVRRAPGDRCPAAGTSTDAALRELRTDRAVIEFDAFVRSQGSNRTQLSGLRYEGATDVYVQVCGVRGDTFNGYGTNIVHVRIGSVHRVARLPMARWSVDWSYDLSSSVWCGAGLDTSGLPNPSQPLVGFMSRVTEGTDPFPCDTERRYEYQPSVAFDLGSLPRDARIARAELRFTEADQVRRARTNRLCARATRAVGLATAPVTGENRHVSSVSHTADDPRGHEAGPSSSRTLDVTDWVAAWQRGRAPAVTFLGLQARGGGDACSANLSNVHVFVEFD